MARPRPDERPGLLAELGRLVPDAAAAKSSQIPVTVLGVDAQVKVDGGTSQGFPSRVAGNAYEDLVDLDDAAVCPPGHHEGVGAGLVRLGELLDGISQCFFALPASLLARAETLPLLRERADLLLDWTHGFLRIGHGPSVSRNLNEAPSTLAGQAAGRGRLGGLATLGEAEREMMLQALSRSGNNKETR